VSNLSRKPWADGRPKRSPARNLARAVEAAIRRTLSGLTFLNHLATHGFDPLVHALLGVRFAAWAAGAPLTAPGAPSARPHGTNSSPRSVRPVRAD
jgi:hypothetical protein